MCKLRWLGLLVLGAVAWGQAAPSAPSPRTKNQPAQAASDDDQQGKTESGLPPDTPVLTITGLCPQASEAQSRPDAAACKTIVTRAEFDRLSSTFKPGMSAEDRRELAVEYAKALVMSERAHERGLDKGPKFEELVRFATMQTLSRELAKKLEEESANITDQDAQQFLDSHAEMFERVSVDRIFVPRTKREVTPSPGGDAAAQQRLVEDEMTKTAEALRSRAAAGEDFASLQKEAFAAAGIQTDPPSVVMDKIRQGALPSTHASVMKLQLGEVSPVISDSSGHYIYKLKTRELPPLAEVRTQIVKTLGRQRMQVAMQEIEHSFSTQVNEDYFPDSSAPTPSGALVNPHSK